MITIIIYCVNEYCVWKYFLVNLNKNDYHSCS